MNLGIVGCGLIGARRAQHLAGARLVHCADIDFERAARLASLHRGCACSRDWRELLDRGDVEALVIATPNDLQAGILRAAILAGKHVLIEKPAARNSAELRDLPALARRHDCRVRVGFNHRYHRALQQARQLVDEGVLGPLMYLRARYGHGGRPGYQDEWRAQPARSGGGELLDQGVHLIDLARWFLGEFVEIGGFAHTYFWDMPVDDNGFMLLRTADRRTAFMHVSCTEWKNTFSFELYGREGKLQVDGLGGSYGVEELTWHRMLPQMGPPETRNWKFASPDDSWEREMEEFIADVRTHREPSAGLDDAIIALDIVGKIYTDSGYDHRS